MVRSQRARVFMRSGKARFRVSVAKSNGEGKERILDLVEKQKREALNKFSRRRKRLKVTKGDLERMSSPVAAAVSSGSGKDVDPGKTVSVGWQKRRKKETSLRCHQCHKNNKGRVVECLMCKRKKYCIQCLERWYPKLPEALCAKACPSCRRNCNCKSCLRGTENARVCFRTMPRTNVGEGN